MKIKILLFSVLMLGIFILFACTNKYPDQASHGAIAGAAGCENCHTNVELLKEVATPQDHSSEEDAGEG